MLSLYVALCGLLLSGTLDQINESAREQLRRRRIERRARRVVDIQIAHPDVIHTQSRNNQTSQVATTLSSQVTTIPKQGNRLVKSASLNAVEDLLSREEQIARWREKIKNW